MLSDPVFWKSQAFIKDKLDTVQINIGNKCNQACVHCHVGASPHGTDNMTADTATKVLDRLLSSPIANIELTGGTPELNSNLTRLVEQLSHDGRTVTVRTSLTVLDLPDFSHFGEFYRDHGVRIVASLPSAFADATDRQRGHGVFDTSLRVLKRLNEFGYGRDGLTLDLVYNPSGDFLPPAQAGLEREYKELLESRHGIQFNNLITIVNAPIRRFKSFLLKEGSLESYMRMLVDNFNPDTLSKVMCRRQVSVDHLGDVYDCDFNLALGIKIKGHEETKLWDIDFRNFYPEISYDLHCYACTAGQGSSCQGALVNNETTTDVKENVRKYYGEQLGSSADLKTSACCTVDSIPAHVRDVLPYIADEIKEKYYGCGSPIPLVLDGLKVLDLGCGTGRDSYVMSKLVGDNGEVWGVDMTEGQIEVAKRHLKEQTARFGYREPNVAFLHDDIENVGAHFPDCSIDLVISNCVLNLLADKKKVFADIFRVLARGGELYFSDVFAGKRVPMHFIDDPVLHGECLAGAMYIEDFRRVLRSLGCPDYRVVEKRSISLDNREIEERLGMIDFYSMTIRAFKLDSLEDICEDYGQVATYLGTVPGHPHRFILDDHHTFIAGKPVLVCGNTATMLSETRFAPHFRIKGDRSVHYGPFDCSPAVGLRDGGDRERQGGCC